jgi:hypothetical protein
MDSTKFRGNSQVCYGRWKACSQSSKGEWNTLQYTSEKTEQGQAPTLKMRRKRVFAEEKEQALTDYLFKISNMLCGLNATEMRHIAYKCAECCGITHNFDGNKEVAGPDWFQAFLKRNLPLSVRTPQANKHTPNTSFNEEEVTRFFQNLEQLMTKYSSSTVWMNLISQLCRTPSLILAPKSQRRVGAATNCDKGMNIRRLRYECKRYCHTAVFHLLSAT